MAKNDVKESLPAGWRGFTLMELLVVIAIISILVAISIASYSTAQKKSRDSRRVADMKAIQNAWEQYYADNQSYPGTDLQQTCTLDLMPSYQTYLPAGFPLDPKKDMAYPEIDSRFSNCSNNAYCFCAGMETANSAYSAVDCSGTGSSGYVAYYCVTNLQ